MRGLSTRDIILVEDYILDNSILIPPFDIIASDVNRDFAVDEKDVIYLRSLLLQEIVDTTLWKFLYGRIEFEDETSPFPYEEGIVHIAESAWHWKELLGVKLGDVDHSALEEIEVNTSIEITTENIRLESGNEYVLDFFLPEGLEVRGFQFSTKNDMPISFIDSDQISIMESNQNTIPDGRVVSWSGGVTVSDQPFLSIGIIGQKIGELVDQIEFIDEIQAEIYIGDDLDVHPLVLNVVGDVKYSTGSLSVTPNPFSESTHISFELDEDSRVQLRVVDALGRLATNYIAEFAKGRNAINLSQFDINGQQAGAYFITLCILGRDSEYSTEILTKKVIFLPED